MFKKIKKKFKSFLLKFLYDKKNNSNDKYISNNLISDKNINSILFLRYDGKIGDMVTNTVMFKEIKSNFPKIKIGVVTRGGAKDIIVDSPWVDEIYSYEFNNQKEILELADSIKGKYDLLISFNNSIKPNELMFISRCNCKYNMGSNKKGWNLFNLSINDNDDFYVNDHITTKYIAYLKKLGIVNCNIKYDIFIKNSLESLTIKYYNTIKNKDSNYKGFFILNPYGADKKRTINYSNLEFIIKEINELGYATILLYTPSKFDELHNFYLKIKPKFTSLYLPNKINNIIDSVALIKYADFVITPDTSIVHIASAFNKPSIVIFRPNGGTYSFSSRKDCFVWAPLGTNNKLIFESYPENFPNLHTMDINNFDLKKMKTYITDLTKLKK